MSITDLGHAAFGCHDLDASLRFYELLGLKESFRLNRDDGTVMLVYIHIAGDRFIELFPGGPTAEERAKTGNTSYRHLCLLSDALVEDVERLRTQGVTIDVEPKQGLDGNMQAWIKDADGNPIELMQIADISPQYAVAHGQKPVIPDLG